MNNEEMTAALRAHDGDDGIGKTTVGELDGAHEVL